MNDTDDWQDDDLHGCSGMWLALLMSGVLWLLIGLCVVAWIGG